LTFAAASLACLKHSARIALADCLCAAASENDKARSAGTSRANADSVFKFRIIASFFGTGSMRIQVAPRYQVIS
jgi:hypothetical protein